MRRTYRWVDLTRSAAPRGCRPSRRAGSGRARRPAPRHRHRAVDHPGDEGEPERVAVADDHRGDQVQGRVLLRAGHRSHHHAGQGDRARLHEDHAPELLRGHAHRPEHPELPLPLHAHEQEGGQHRDEAHGQQPSLEGVEARELVRHLLDVPGQHLVGGVHLEPGIEVGPADRRRQLDHGDAGLWLGHHRHRGLPAVEARGQVVGHQDVLATEVAVVDDRHHREGHPTGGGGQREVVARLDPLRPGQGRADRHLARCQAGLCLRAGRHLVVEPWVGERRDADQVARPVADDDERGALHPVDAWHGGQPVQHCRGEAGLGKRRRSAGRCWTPPRRSCARSGTR